MAEPSALPLQTRDATGKGASRALRRSGFIPGIVYGGNQDPVSVKLPESDLHRAVRRGRFFSTLVDLDVDGKRVRAIPRDIQYDVVRDIPIHVDFLRISPNSEVTLFVPVTFVNEEESPGIRRGGVLNVVRHDVELRVRARDIPEELVVDISGLDIGDVVHFSAIELPKGARSTIIGRDFAVATIAAPSAIAAAARAEQEEAAEAAEIEEEVEEEEPED